MSCRDKQQALILLLTLVVISMITVLTIVMLERTMLSVKLASASLKQVQSNEFKK